VGVGRDAPADLTARPQFTLFAVLWAVAAFFHVWFGPLSNDLATTRSQLGAAELAVAAAAAVVLVVPRFGTLLVLAAVEIWSAVLEAPIIGNHWVLVALVDVGLLLIATRRRGPDGFAPLGRACLLGFYGFAAFAKLNHGFFTVATSCGTYYFDETLKSLGLGGIHTAGTNAGWAVVVGTAATELSIPVLLVWRRTRYLGVALGLAFHSLVALDQKHLFSDFSSTLTALFTLFLPGSFAAWVAGRRLGPVRLVAAVGGLAVTTAMVGSGAVHRPFDTGRHVGWIAFDVLVLGFAGTWLWRHRAVAPAEHPLRLPARWLAIVPALVVLNGMTPYLELKDSYSWNMYANLRTVDGDSNQFLVARTLPLMDVNADLVRVMATSDAGLALYTELRYDLPYTQFRAYLAHHPSASVTYRRHGQVVRLDHASDDPALVAPVPAWQAKLLAFRAVDQDNPPRCQAGFLPAD
jgi:hypothetical protein